MIRRKLQKNFLINFQNFTVKLLNKLSQITVKFLNELSKLNFSIFIKIQWQNFMKTFIPYDCQQYRLFKLHILLWWRWEFQMKKTKEFLEFYQFFSEFVPKIDYNINFKTQHFLKSFEWSKLLWNQSEQLGNHEFRVELHFKLQIEFIIIIKFHGCYGKASAHAATLNLFPQHPRSY